MLNTEPNLPDADAFYEALLANYQDLTEAQARALDARLILLLCNHIGDPGVLRQAMARAREGLGPAGPDAAPSLPT